MSGETEESVSGWTTDTLKFLIDDRRRGEEKFQAERDRRLSEVAVEREKALKIKETADLAALQLAREIQTYKDEKANELREQINSERGLYATKADVVSAVEKVEVTIKPLAEFVTSQQGRQQGIGLSAGVLLGAVTLFGVIAGAVVKLAGG